MTPDDITIRIVGEPSDEQLDSLAEWLIDLDASE